MFQGVGSSRRQDANESERKTLPVAYRVWLLSLLICTLAIAAAFRYFDLAIATRVYGILPSAKSLATGFASAFLLGVETAIALALILFRIVRGYLSPLGRVTVLACLTSICAYAINDSTLKLLFGVPVPAAVLHGAQHVFHLLGGSSRSSFPSGHMVLAGSFAGVFMRFYRNTIVPFSTLLLIAAALLILGDWHFLSDVIAGTFVGVSAGLLAGELWLIHAS
ncbi:MAG: phosphatase PAP2 family protein [Acidobacteria bacterium]|nr:phosphatase PAP2 family protein [Acidobacteriota bacterium]